MKTQTLNKLAKKNNTPTPMNINSFWNVGSSLAISLVIQVLTGMILAMNYNPSMASAFDSIVYISDNVKYGWMMRMIHSNGASVYFLIMYTHILRGIFYSLYKKTMMWLVGVVILLMSMMTAFLGYVLPWGQMSYWGATVITNMLTSLPYVGKTMLEWVWGGPSINNATLERFFVIHFILPIIIILMVLIHLIILHHKGSSNPIGISSYPSMIPLHPYFMMSDYMGFILMFMILLIISTQSPFILMDPDNFTPANPTVTPPHIKPEWYFLFSYAILRSIPSKSGGVICMILSIIVILSLPLYKSNMMMPNYMTPPSMIMFWIMLSSLILLTWTGSKPIEFPFNLISTMAMKIYFSFFIMNPCIHKMWMIMLKK